MTEAVSLAVAVAAVSLGYFLRTVVPYLNALADDPNVPFEGRYAILGVALWMASVWVALTTVGGLPDLVRESPAAIFLGYLLLAMAGNHLVFEAVDKATPEIASTVGV